MSACFVAGAAGSWEDEEGEKGVLGAGSFAIRVAMEIIADR